MDEQPLDDVLDEVHAFVRRELAAGCWLVEDIPLMAADRFEETCGSAAAQAAAERFLPSALAAQLAEEASWPPVTDCDRLEMAFDDLEAAGIVARENVICCTTCGHAEMIKEIHAIRAEGLRVRGYTFFTMDDVESAVAGGGILLAYGTEDDDEAGILCIGQEVRNVLEARGLAIDWDGTANRKIWVRLRWQRRCDVGG